MNEFKRVNKTTSFLTITITLFLIATMGVTMLISVDFDITQINWFDFVSSTFNWLIARMTYYNVGTQIGDGEEQIKLLSSTINRYRNIIYKKKINKEFRDKIEKHNRVSKCSAYMDFVDNKLSTVKNKKKLMYWNSVKMNLMTLLPLLEADKLEEYTGNINIDTVKVKYDKLEFANIFAYGSASHRVGEKYYFNPALAGVTRSYAQFIVTLVASFLNASLVVLSYGFSVLALYMFVFKIIMFALGAYQGIKVGKEVILEVKYSVMLNLADRTKEILTELEKENNITLDDGQPVEA
jgi:hypothetical protein